MPKIHPVLRVAAPLRLQVVDAIRQAIVNGEFAYGSRLVESRLCERFEVSRTVVREAIRQLEAEQLVRVVPNHGPIVAELSEEDAVSLYEIRAALEGLAGGLFAERANVDNRKALKTAMLKLRKSYESGDLSKILSTKDRFYQVLIEGSRNLMIPPMLAAVNARIQLLRSMSLRAPGRSDESLLEVEEIANAALDGDAPRTRAACEVHVKRAAQVAIAELKRKSASALEEQPV